jgi:hypothetical protein
MSIHTLTREMDLATRVIHGLVALLLLLGSVMFFRLAYLNSFVWGRIQIDGSVIRALVFGVSTAIDFDQPTSIRFTNGISVRERVKDGRNWWLALRQDRRTVILSPPFLIPRLQSQQVPDALRESWSVYDSRVG